MKIEFGEILHDLSKNVFEYIFSDVTTGDFKVREKGPNVRQVYNNTIAEPGC
jgi:hypothetical protein